MPLNPKRQLPRITTINDELFDAIIRHQIFILRVSGSIRNEVTELLNSTEKDLADKIRNILRAEVSAPLALKLKQFEKLAKQIREIRDPMWDRFAREIQSRMVDLTGEEVGFLKQTTSVLSPVVLTPIIPSASELTSLVRNNPFQGRTLKEWSKNIRETDIDRILTQIRVGLVQGETGPQIARRIVGTARLKGADGVTQITRRNAASLVRTSVIAFSNMAKREFYKANKDILSKELYVATLDSRTTRICSSLDGEIFEIGIGPIPPLHFNCRSARVAYFGEDAFTPSSVRPFKVATEKMLVKEFTAAKGLKSFGLRSRLPRGFKGKFDIFARKRIRELTGTVPAKVSYQEWLSTQSVPFQNEVLGVTKARLFRRGDLPLDRFVNKRGDELTLSQLAKKDKQAFIDAGLDPVNFN